MRIKFLSRWSSIHCLMGNEGLSSSSPSCVEVPFGNIKLIKPDGEVKMYDRPVKASELMMEYPKHMVCRSDSFYIGQKIPPLSEHDHLQLGHNYFLLPSHFFHSVLSFLTVASFASSSSQQPPPILGRQSQPPPATHSSSSSSLISYRDDGDDLKNVRAAFLKKAAASSCSPFDLQKTQSGSLRIRVSEDFISQLMIPDQQGTKIIKAKQSEEEEQLLCTTPQLEKDYKQLVIGSRRHWKPKLDMIKETPKEKFKKLKVLKLISSATRFGIKSIKKKKNSKSHHESSSSSSSSGSGTHKMKKTKLKRPVAPPPQLHQLQSHHRLSSAASTNLKPPKSKKKIKISTTSRKFR